MTAEQVCEKIKEAGLECSYYFSTAGTVIQVRVGNTSDCVNSLLPLDEESHEQFVAYLIQETQKCLADPEKLKGLMKFTQLVTQQRRVRR